jgi:hypothetical protein
MSPETEDTLFFEVINLELEEEAIQKAVGDGEPSEEQCKRLNEICAALERYYGVFDDTRDARLYAKFMVPL